MFEAYADPKQSQSDDGDEAGSQQWGIIRLARDRPFLMVSLSYDGDHSRSYGTFLLYSLAQLLELRDELESHIEKVQLLEPDDRLGSGWQIHDIVNIRTIQVPVEISETSYDSCYREEYHSSDGRCFTFSELSDDDPVRTSHFHSIYSVATPNPPRPIEDD